MNTVTFDTLTYTRRLRDAGFSEQQAEALARAQADAFEQMLATSQIATKADILLLQKDIAALSKEMAEMEARLVKSFYNAMYGFAGIVIAAVAVTVAIFR